MVSLLIVLIRSRSRPRLEAVSVLAAVGQGILLVVDGRITYANASFRALFGRDGDWIEGRGLDAVFPPQEAASLVLPDAGQGLPRELSLVRGDGATVWVQVSAAPIEIGGERAMLVSITDVSARRESEARRRELSELSRRQEEQLEHSTRLAELGEMAAAISHELNQPLTGIRNYARNAYYMLEQKRGAEEDVKTNLRLISEQVDRAAKIINEMRELTRRADSAFVTLDLNSVIRETADFLLPQMKLSEVTVVMELSDPLPMIWGDRIRLAQVLLNLLSNARQAMEGAPSRRLVIASRYEPADVLPVIAEVRDTGKGFDAEQSGRLFQPFYTTRKAGHGLGLSISRAIVQDHNGSLTATGSPGQGAVFTIRLPTAQREQSRRAP